MASLHALLSGLLKMGLCPLMYRMEWGKKKFVSRNILNHLSLST